MNFNPGTTLMAPQMMHDYNLRDQQRRFQVQDQRGQELKQQEKERKQLQRTAKSVKSAWKFMQDSGLVGADAIPENYSDVELAALPDAVSLMGDVVTSQFNQKRTSQMQAEMDAPAWQPSVMEVDGQKVLMTSPKSAQILDGGESTFNPSTRDIDGDGTADGYMSSKGSFQMFSQENQKAPADPRFTKYQGAVVKFDPMTYGVWDPQKSVYDLKTAPQGSSTKFGEFEQRTGGMDLSGMPQWRDPMAPPNAEALMGPRRSRVAPVMDAALKGETGNVKPEMKAGGPARISTTEEYNALPKGALFIDPEDGKTYRKP